MYEHLKIEERGAVAVMTISAPKSLNALNSTILKEMDDFISHFDCNKFRCLIVTGDGEKSFVAGADISEMATLNVPQGQTFGSRGAAVFRKIEKLPVPVIAAVNGFALGGGCELAMACDIRICSDNARFGQPEVGLGIIPGFSGTVRLARLVGMGMAKQLIYTGKNIKADDRSPPTRPSPSRPPSCASTPSGTWMPTRPSRSRAAPSASASPPRTRKRA